MPDPNKPADFSYLMQEFQQAFLLRAEIAKATGVPPDQIETVFGELQGPLLKVFERIKFEEIVNRIRQEITAQAQKELKERVEALGKSQETSMRKILERRREQLKGEIEELRRKQEERTLRTKEEGEVVTSGDVAGAIYNFLGEETINAVGIAEISEGKITTFFDIEKLRLGLEMKLNDLEEEINKITGGKGRKGLEEERDRLLQLLAEKGQVIETKDSQGNIAKITPNEQLISEINTRLSAIRDLLEKGNELKEKEQEMMT